MEGGHGPLMAVKLGSPVNIQPTSRGFGGINMLVAGLVLTHTHVTSYNSSEVVDYQLLRGARSLVILCSYGRRHGGTPATGSPT